MVGAVVFLMAMAAVAGEVILPTFAWNLPGKGGNNWNSEVYLTNPGPEEIEVTLAGVFMGRIKVTHPCYPPTPVRMLVPAYSTMGWVASRIAMDLGCPDYALVGLLLGSEGHFVVNSRMVNTFATPDPDAVRLLNGLSQEVPGIPVEDLAQPRATYMVPGLGWEPSPCGPVRFENYLQVVNPGDEAVTLTLLSDPLAGVGDLLVDGKPVRAPHSVEIKARSWLQIRIGPKPAEAGICKPAGVGDVFFQTSGPIALYASVVDRTTQDPRTMLPVRAVLPAE